MEYGIYRMKHVADKFRCEEGFIFDHTTERFLSFESKDDAEDFIVDAFCCRVGVDYEVRPITK